MSQLLEEELMTLSTSPDQCPGEGEVPQSPSWFSGWKDGGLANNATVHDDV